MTPPFPRETAFLRRHDRLLLIGAACLVAAYHWYFTSWGLKSGFSYDDLMNLGGSLQSSILEILRDIVLFFRPTPLIRPLGSLWYRLTYEAFGFTPLPYRIGIHLLMACNVALAYRVFVLLGSRRSVAMMGALIMSYHSELQVFLFNTGFVYDLWCFLFYFLALAVYLTRRNHHPDLRKRDIALVLLLQILALDAKEPAVTLPVMLFAIELVRKERWTWNRAAPFLLSGAVTAAFLLGRVFGPGGIGRMGGGYQTEYTFHKWMTQGAVLIRQFFMLDASHAPWLYAAIFGGIALFCLLSRERAPVLGLTLALVGVLPIIFLDRGLATGYIGMAGFALSVAWLLHALISAVLVNATLGSVLSFCVLFGFLASRGVERAIPLDAAYAEHRYIDGITTDVRALDLHPPSGARILMLCDPFPQYRWNSTFLMMILFHDARIGVDWVSAKSIPYYATLTTEGGHVRRAAIRP